MSDDRYVVDLRYTEDGVSVSVYDRADDMALVDEGWHTWAEVEERKGNGSDMTFEFGGA